jgi:hypothetical protein
MRMLYAAAAATPSSAGCSATRRLRPLLYDQESELELELLELLLLLLELLPLLELLDQELELLLPPLLLEEDEELLLLLLLPPSLLDELQLLLLLLASCSLPSLRELELAMLPPGQSTWR